MRRCEAVLISQTYRGFEILRIYSIFPRPLLVNFVSYFSTEKLSITPKNDQLLSLKLAKELKT